MNLCPVSVVPKNSKKTRKHKGIAQNDDSYILFLVDECNQPKPRRWHLIAAILADARLAWAMLIGTAIYGIMAWFEIPLFPCPWKNVTGLPCPGCGMTRSTLALLHGRFRDSLQYNALTWVMLLFWMIVAIVITLPARYRNIWIARIGHWENRSRWGLWFAGIIVIYTLTRWLTIG